MMMIFIMLSLLSLHNATTHILITAHALSDAEVFNVHGLQEPHYSMEDNVVETHSLQVVKVSGADEKEAYEVSVVEKFRALLGLRSLHKRRRNVDYNENVSPSPSPSPPFSEVKAPSPGPAHVLHIHRLPHHPHKLRSISPPRKFVGEDHKKGRTREILITVLILGGAVTLLCVLGLIWGCKKYKQHKKKPTRVISLYGEKRGETNVGSMYVGSSTAASKVSLNSAGTHDLIYLDDLEQEQHQQSSRLEKYCENVNALSPNHSTQRSTLHEVEEEEEEEESNSQYMVKPDFDNVNTSSTREITSVHEDVEESVKYESDSANSSIGVKVAHIDAYSSDEESFHSFEDSNSSSIRLSNASAGSLGDNNTSEIHSTNVSNRESCLAPPPSFITPPNQSVTPNQTSIPALTATPPTPTPPPPPPIHFPPFSSSVKTSTIASKPSSSSTLKILSPPRKSSCSSSGSNQISNSIPFPPLKTSQTPSSIPPPPCPPPFMKATNSSAKGPPPPPLPQMSPLGKDGTPLPKLKPLHWDKVRAAPDHSMVWDKLRSSSFEFDEDMIESLFGYNLQNTMKNDEGKSKTPSPSKHVLEPKRLQNITILSKALNATTEQVCEALVQGTGLCLQQLEALAKMVPTNEEEAKLSGYKGDIKELGSVEKFVKAVLNIPFAFQRVEAMLYRETFEDEVVHLSNSFSILEEACKELRSSRLFLKLLEAVLKTGNRMNVGTIRGGARAFKLDALLKLSDVKGTDGKTTLLHFVVQEIIRAEGIRVSDSIMGRISQKNKVRTVEEKEEDYRRMGLDLVSGLSTELYNAKKTATLDLDVLASGVSNLSDGMTKLKQLINKELAMDERNGNFENSMKSFISYAEKSLKELQGDENRVLSHVKEITEYFHGNVSKEEANPLRIFVIVRDFLGMLDHVCKELRSSKATRTPNPLAPFR